MVKFLIRGEKGNFLEATIENSSEFVKINPTKTEINPRDLVHFGSDVITDGWDLYAYTENMKTQGVDYILISEYHRSFEHKVKKCDDPEYSVPEDFLQSESIRGVTAYLKK